MKTKTLKMTIAGFLVIIASIIALITIMLFGLYVPKLNKEVEKIHEDINNITAQIDISKNNVEYFSLQQIKIVSAKGTYKILESINSSHIKSYETLLKELYMLLPTVMKEDKGKQITLPENLTIEGASKEFVESFIKTIEHHNSLVEVKKSLGNDLNKKIQHRDNTNIWIVIFQGSGLLIGIIGTYLKL